ncbi:MAG: metallophosphoesterase [Bacilli bacterium]|nr:metallophosphoesterase [Bacilli bacterium]
MMKVLLGIVGFMLLIALILYIKRWVSKVVNHYYHGDKSKVISWVIVIIYLALTFNFHSSLAIVLLFGILSFFITDVFMFIFNYLIKSEKFNKSFKKLSETAVIPVVITIIILMGAYVNAVTVLRTEYDVNTDKILKNGKLKIAQISDLHFPTTMNDNKLKKIVKKISDEKVDILVLTGDIFDERTAYDEMKKACKTLGNIKTKSGIYFIFGNHDDNHYTKRKNYGEDDLLNELNKNDIKVLADETVLINNDFYIVGRYDKSMVSHDRKLISRLTKGLDKEKYIILLDHQPLELKDAAKNGVDLEIGGHTHAGQIWPLGVAAQLAGTNENKYGIKRIGDYTSVVSSGTGTWRYPLRTEGKTEYVIINVHEK